MTLSNKAMVVTLHISSWKARKADKKVTAKTNIDHGADKNAGIYNKFLIPKKEMEALQTAESEARSFHKTMTLPWKDGGDRLLPAKNFMKYNKGIRDCKQKFDRATQAFVNQYPYLVNAAQKELGGMYDVNDYPSTGKIGQCFEFFTDINPVPAAGDFRVELQEDEVAKIKKAIDKTNESRYKEAMSDLWTRLYDVVKTMAEGMKEEKDPVTGTVIKKSKVFDSYVENIKALTDILPDLNIAEDQALNDLAKKVRDELTGHTPGQLRKNSELRENTVQSAEEIMKQMNGYIGIGGNVNVK